MSTLKGRGATPRVWFETRGGRSRPPMVLLHGFTGTHRTWDALADRLGKTCFLIMPDLPGHGRSATQRSSASMSVRATADAVLRLMDAVCRGRRVALVGYSLGGRVALDLAARHPGRLSCLVLEGASPGLRLPEEREERRRADRALAHDIELRGLEWFVDYWQDTPLFAHQRLLPPEAFDAIRRDRLSNTARGLAMSLRAAGTGEMAPLWDELGGIATRVLVVVGSADRKYAEVGMDMWARIPGSSLAEVDGAGHCVHLDKPAEFVDLVEEFVGGGSPPLRASSTPRRGRSR
ncbi:MAG: 2-succinyl-6-hydroxy-2,4-cyclohexadiene-1-carboxylate synthase [Nitrososphaerota archaeon]|nr:2-succinyl-6-hydroxy-2,4-cyclohexadiene-1-carboxylate synthase [Nitrososphaerota archaeon]